MIRSENAATDVLSSLPVIACCIVSVMMLMGAFSHALAGGYRDSESKALVEECQRILSTTLLHLTSARDGRRYIAHDWEDRLKGIDFNPEAGRDASASIEVRLFDHAPYELALTGNTSMCQEVRSASEPVILINHGRLNPGEIIVRAGR
ncbi:MAG TPA: hypothetical protein VMW02_01060 [Thermoplasmata archaeon]|nr:hypothetical protein [Thermoplasmata archaeon]